MCRYRMEGGGREEVCRYRMQGEGIEGEEVRHERCIVCLDRIT